MSLESPRYYIPNLCRSSWSWPAFLVQYCSTWKMLRNVKDRPAPKLYEALVFLWSY